MYNSYQFLLLQDHALKTTGIVFRLLVTKIRKNITAQELQQIAVILQ